MKKTLRDLTTDLQTICHNGMSDCEVGIKILDSFYKVGEIKKVVVHGEQPREVFVIEAKGCNEE